MLCAAIATVMLVVVLRRGAPAGGGERDCAGGRGVRACQRASGFVWDEAPGVEGYKRIGARSGRVGAKFALRLFERLSVCLGRVGCRIHGSLRNADRAEPH